MLRSIAGRTSPAQPSRTLRPESTPGRGAGPRAAGLFTATLFLGAALLFCVQPMVARAVLPALGGSPAVWNTCMVFFQACLLAGYAYAHLLSSRLGLRTQAVVHALVVATPLLVLPLALGAGGGPDSSAAPVAWLLTTLLATVGLPFLVIATTAPLLQRWFAATGHRSASDPYFLYAASNFGSMVALLGYPLLVEPSIRLAWQGRLWSAGYVVLAALVVACGALAVRSGGSTGPDIALPEAEIDAVGPRRWLRWVGLAFVPSSLMLGVTSYASTDIAAIPLLWVIPLALYLLTFIVVFDRRTWISGEMAAAATPAALMLLAWTMAVSSEVHPSILALHLTTFFLVAMVCHGALAADRPGPRHLTGFYLAMSAGGVLGGLFNALVAPLVFDRIVEYALVLGLSCLALPAPASDRVATARTPRWLPFVLGLGLAGAIAGRIAGTDHLWAEVLVKLGAGLVAGLGLAGFRRRPVGLALVCLALLFTKFLPGAEGGRVLWRGRDFFGVLTVTENDGRDHRLVHGRTLHGRQNLDPASKNEPLTYYHRTGPVGDLFRALESQSSRHAPRGLADGTRSVPATGAAGTLQSSRHAPRAVFGDSTRSETATPEAASAGMPAVGVVGLGAGSMAAYARPNERWTFYEIDPAVIRVAGDPRFFTFLSDCKAGSLELVLGDARLRLREAPERGFHLLVLDAFSSDAIPVHLLTREALALYRARTAEGGIIAFHISNRYIDLRPVLGALARDAGLVCRVRADLATTPEEAAQGKSASIWAVMAARAEDLGPIADDPRWVAPRGGRNDAAWSDDFSDVVSHLIGWK